MFYKYIPPNLEVVRYGFAVIRSLLNFIGISAVKLQSDILNSIPDLSKVLDNKIKFWHSSVNLHMVLRKCPYNWSASDVWYMHLGVSMDPFY